MCWSFGHQLNKKKEARKTFTPSPLPLPPSLMCAYFPTCCYFRCCWKTESNNVVDKKHANFSVQTRPGVLRSDSYCHETQPFEAPGIRWKTASFVFHRMHAAFFLFQNKSTHAQKDPYRLLPTRCVVIPVAGFSSFVFIFQVKISNWDGFLTVPCGQVRNFVL